MSSENAIVFARTSWSRNKFAAAANLFLLQLVRANTIAFSDDMRHAPWTAGYYINNAVYRVTEMQGAPRSHLGSKVRTLRLAWNESFKYLAGFVAATIPFTTTPR